MLVQRLMPSCSRVKLASYCDLLSTHPIERTANVERPDIVQRLQPVSASEYPDLVLTEHSGVGVARREASAREHRSPPAASEC